MISVLNYKPFDKGSIIGFFDMRYHGLTVKGCKLLEGNDGLWFSFPQLKSTQDGETKYFDQMFLTPLEREHVRKLVLIDLVQQGHIEREESRSQRPRAQHQSPEGEDLSEHYTEPGGDIPF